MSTQEELREKARQKIDDLSTKINSLKDKPLEDIAKKDRLDEIIKELEETSENIKSTYIRLMKENEKKWDEFDKNVYRDMKSFDDAFRKAGSIFESGSQK